METVPVFIGKIQYNSLFDIFEESKYLAHAANVLGHTVQVIINPNSTEGEEQDDALLGMRFRRIRNLKSLSSLQINPFDEDKAVNYGFVSTFKVILNHSRVPFDTTEIVASFHEDSHQSVIVVALARAYAGLPYDADSNILSATKDFQKHAIPPLFYYNAVRVSTSGMVLTYDPYQSRNVVSPFQQMRSVAPSPVPVIPEYDEDHDDTEESESESEENPNPWTTQGRRGRHFVAEHVPVPTSPKIPPRQFYGAGSAPDSVPPNSTYNEQPLVGGKGKYPKKFSLFWEQGETGINGKRVPENDRLRLYTGYLLSRLFTGKGADNAEVIAYMKTKLEDHFDEWNKINWTKIKNFKN